MWPYDFLSHEINIIRTKEFTKFTKCVYCTLSFWCFIDSGETYLFNKVDKNAQNRFDFKQEPVIRVTPKNEQDPGQASLFRATYSNPRI